MSKSLKTLTEPEAKLWRAYHHLFFPNKPELWETHRVLIAAIYAIRKG